MKSIFEFNTPLWCENKTKTEIEVYASSKIYLFDTGIQKHIIDIAIKLLIYWYTEYQKTAKFLKEDDSKQRSIEKFLSPIATLTCAVKREYYNHQHPRQAVINNAIVKVLIVVCLLPLLIVEIKHFQRFMNIVEPRSTKLPIIC